VFALVGAATMGVGWYIHHMGLPFLDSAIIMLILGGTHFTVWLEGD
jgi:hypothetical protein